MPEHVAQTADGADRYLIWLARLGYCTRGAVYLVVAALALLAALGEGGRTTGTKGALREVLSSPFGEVMTGAIVLGLFGYALWRFVQSIKDADNHGTGVKGLAIRGGLLVSALTHALLGFYAASLLVGGALGGGDGQGSSDLAAKLMQQPWGRWLAFLAALGILAVAGAHAIKALGKKYRKYFAVDRKVMARLDPLIQFGLLARSVIFTIIAFFMAYAAYTYDPDKAGGLDAALTFIQGQAYGTFLLAVIAAGLFAFGIYSFLEGIYRRIHPG